MGTRTQNLISGLASALAAVLISGCDSAGAPAADPSAAAAAQALPPSLTAGDLAPDATFFGPNYVTQAEYKLPAAIDPDVLPGVYTEAWAQVYRPLYLGSRRHPLLIFLHGNHHTCGAGYNPRTDD